ncbi:hypothetical protein GEV33_008466 [Tenebrio molitor]|uniref:Fibronectin type-III domain-containing protein n=1 Tax=Tenebrio molitor TaxID=7067 RepID=A0A8J6LAQ3_TENMO|nr:hypothetical protein GEV33_008466 [Tenebrio molitor]
MGLRSGDLAGNWNQVDLTESPMSLAALIEDLNPATKYTFRVIAVGPAGKSPPSSELIIRTEPQRPAGAPLNLSVRSLSSTEVIVTWIPPSPELRHGEIQGFNVGYRTATMGAFNFTTVMGDGEDGGELLLGGLEKYTRYTIVVQAFNEVGTGPLSETVPIQTMEDVAPEPFGDGVRDLEECSMRVSKESAARTYCLSGRTWTLLALPVRGEREKDERTAGWPGFPHSGKERARTEGESGKAGDPSQWEGTGQEEKEKTGWSGFPRNGKERARKKRRKRDGRGSLAMGGNGPGRKRGKRDGRGSLTAGRNGPGRRKKAGRPGFPRNGRERARKKRRKRDGRGSLAMGRNGPGGKRAGCRLGRKQSRSRFGSGTRSGKRIGIGMSSACRLGAVLLLPRPRHGGTARGRRLAAGAVGELGSARSPGIVGRKKHGFRGGFADGRVVEGRATLSRHHREVSRVQILGRMGLPWMLCVVVFVLCRPEKGEERGWAWVAGESTPEPRRTTK